MRMIKRHGMQIQISKHWIYDAAIENVTTHEGPWDTVVDIGAHAGSFSLYAAKVKNAKRVFSFEPYNIYDLAANIVRNSLQDRVFPISVAIGPGLSKMEIARCGSCDGMVAVCYPEEIKVDPREVISIGFEDLFEIFDVIDVMKIDVEGAEYMFLDPSPETAKLMERVRALDMEFHGNPGKFMPDFLVHPGYNDRLKPQQELRSFLVGCGFDNLRQDGIHLFSVNRKFKGDET